jgi:hypothetical protein
MSEDKPWSRSVRKAVVKYREALASLGPDEVDGFVGMSVSYPDSAAQDGHIHIMDVIRARKVVDKWGVVYEGGKDWTISAS